MKTLSPKTLAWVLSIVASSSATGAITNSVVSQNQSTVSGKSPSESFTSQQIPMYDQNFNAEKTEKLEKAVLDLSEKLDKIEISNSRIESTLSQKQDEIAKLKQQLENKENQYYYYYTTNDCSETSDSHDQINNITNNKYIDSHDQTSNITNKYIDSHDQTSNITNKYIDSHDQTINTTNNQVTNNQITNIKNPDSSIPPALLIPPEPIKLPTTSENIPLPIEPPDDPPPIAPPFENEPKNPKIIASNGPKPLYISEGNLNEAISKLRKTHRHTPAKKSDNKQQIKRDLMQSLVKNPKFREGSLQNQSPSNITKINKKKPKAMRCPKNFLELMNSLKKNPKFQKRESLIQNLTPSHESQPNRTENPPSTPLNSVRKNLTTDFYSTESK